MEAIRVTEEWQRAGVHYVRTDAMVKGFGIPLQGEFADDTPQDEYVLVLDGVIPVSACRLHILDADTAKIERVATVESYRGQHYGSAGILEAENWLKEKGIKKVLINSRVAAVKFYEKLGYKPDYTQLSGSGDFECVITEKWLTDGEDA
jgi:GNAT superfamily N-acetyltransferase